MDCSMMGTKHGSSLTSASTGKNQHTSEQQSMQAHTHCPQIPAYLEQKRQLQKMKVMSLQHDSL